MGKKKEPRFVNMQAASIMVLDENKHRVVVAPWDKRESAGDVPCVVEGEHYRQFVSDKGPLYVHPDDVEAAPVYVNHSESTPAPVAPASEDGGDSETSETDMTEDTPATVEDVPTEDTTDTVEDVPTEDTPAPVEDEQTEEIPAPVENVAQDTIEPKKPTAKKKPRLGRNAK